MEDPVTLTWRELMRWMLVGSDNTSAAVIMQHIGEHAVDAVARDAGMTATRIAHSADTVRDAVEAARAGTLSAGFSGRDLDDDLIAFAQEDRVLGSVTTAEDQVALLSALWSGGLLNQAGTRMVCAMMQQKLSHHRISRTFGYPGFRSRERPDLGVLFGTIVRL
ncbi:serine hydrolase [Leucobacter coleopterorum]|uniref:Serine hydrolase n=1 Tax=Leucobacter coleopterorum TaxID=2714933 RepID=A0ABX6JTF0_9MICO|nr:serine hydrolase [Leucobacter coleopterorum]QIM17578.1 serine hydrolase [Leucobacter coleopterorum]